MDGESALGACGGRRAPYLDARTGWVPQAAKNVFKRPVWMGLFLALVSRRVLVTQMLLAVGRKERDRWAASKGMGRGDMSYWVF